MIEGIHTSLVTPFTSDLAVDEAALRGSVRYQIAAGVSGVCALGGTGEPLSMTTDEHRQIIDIVVDETAGRFPVTIGCLLGGEAEILALARHARVAGADRIMIVPPYFYSVRPYDVRRHLETIAEVCDLPIIFFHSPGRTGVRLTADELLELFHAVPSVKGVKDASGDMVLAGEIIQGAPAGFSFLQGLDELLLPSFAVGATGAVVSLGELLPAALASLHRWAIEGDLVEARRVQLDILPLCRWVYSEPNPGPLKFALALAGRPAGPCRRPIHGPRDDTREALRELVPPLLGSEACIAAGRRRAVAGQRRTGSNPGPK